jgi:hypothetical protein
LAAVRASIGGLPAGGVGPCLALEGHHGAYDGPAYELSNARNDSVSERVDLVQPLGKPISASANQGLRTSPLGPSSGIAPPWWIRAASSSVVPLCPVSMYP